MMYQTPGYPSSGFKPPFLKEYQDYWDFLYSDEIPSPKSSSVTRLTSPFEEDKVKYFHTNFLI